MSVGEIAFLVLVIGALSLFAGVLAFALIMEWRDARKSGPAVPVRVTVKAVGHSGKRASRAF